MSGGWHVTVEFNTEADGSPVAKDATEFPRCHFGPFPDEAAAIYWMEEIYPDGDTDVYDMWVVRPEDSGDLGYVNPPETVSS